MTRDRRPSENVPTEGLSIGDLAAATGVPQATLRTWEVRHGFPAPARLPAGHRRYQQSDVVVVGEVERRRAAGQTLSAAIEAAVAARQAPETSLFAGLRQRHPHLGPRTLHKSTLLALTRAIEDECCARAEQPVLFAAFQAGRFYTQSHERWTELARTARSTVVFTDSDRSDDPGGRLRHVAVPAQSPMRREWALVCDAVDHPACVAGWEIAGSNAVPDADRPFEVIWTVDPQVVRDAARICAGLADPGAGLDLGHRLHDRAPAASPDLQRAQGLLERTLGYLDQRGTG